MCLTGELSFYYISRYAKIKEMKPWEEEKTRKRLKKMSGNQAIKVFFELYKAGRRILLDSLRAEFPKISQKSLRLKLNQTIRRLENR